MDIRHLQYFLEVARWKSFTKAAEALYITQPTISKMIKKLEDDMGVVLFERLGKHVELTDAGRIIFDQVQSIVKSFQNLSSELDDLMSLRRGSIRIGLPPMIGSSFFPKVIGQFRNQYPGITVHLVEDGAKKVEADVESGILDIGVVLLPTNEEVFHTFSIVKDHLMLIVHPSNPLANRKIVTLSELAQEPFVLFREDFALHDIIINACMRVGFRPEVIHESSQWDFIREMVAINLGVGLLPKTVCQGFDPTRVKIIPLIEPIIPWNLSIIWRKDRYLSFAAREWIRITQTLLTTKE